MDDFLHLNINNHKMLQLIFVQQSFCWKSIYVRCAVGYWKRAKDGAKVLLSGTLFKLVEQRVPVLLLSDIELFPMEHSNRISHEDSCCA